MAQKVFTAPLRDDSDPDNLKMTKVLRLQDLRLPVHITLGHYEAATQEELSELIVDLNHELARREGTRTS